ncbi:hypothetical protein [Kribbella sp. CA-293567]|uniref:hypothetical protein n=1 Tax=Kribbella sp. CA-293567 TaxID=3002436 RepID=UPI0022DE83D7|nr:hypothetical protein [Kribbella sp. CA-293567]WBQ06301.1 hypothetical protein OX958_05775 [Kribbella sp. CA-293567]
MRKHRPKWLPAAALLALVVGGAWFSDHLNGSSLAETDAVEPLTGSSAPRQGEDVYFLAPELANKSRQPLELKAIAPKEVQPGLEFVGARVYQKPDRRDAAAPSWTTRDSAENSPLKLRSEPVGGQQLAAESTFDRVIYLRYKVTSDQRPLRSTGVEVTYHRGFRDHTQVLPITFEVSQRGQLPGE